MSSALGHFTASACCCSVCCSGTSTPSVFTADARQRSPHVASLQCSLEIIATGLGQDRLGRPGSVSRPSGPGLGSVPGLGSRRHPLWSVPFHLVLSRLGKVDLECDAGMCFYSPWRRAKFGPMSYCPRYIHVQRVSSMASIAVCLFSVSSLLFCVCYSFLSVFLVCLSPNENAPHPAWRCCGCSSLPWASGTHQAQTRHKHQAHPIQTYRHTLYQSTLYRQMKTENRRRDAARTD